MMKVIDDKKILMVIIFLLDYLQQILVFAIQLLVVFILVFVFMVSLFL